MAGESDDIGGSVVTESSSVVTSVDESKTEEKKSKEVVSKEKDSKKKRKGLLSRMWNALFSSGKEDFEGRLQRISKDEATVLNRLRRRARNWGRIKRHIILFSLFFEFIAVSYALMYARTAEDWKSRAFRVLPMFLLPAVSSIAYSAIARFINMCERKDNKTLERLRGERQSKIDELKEKTNYYITQQLIQRYDTDPAAKAAAATVLASKLGADSGLRVFVEDESKINAVTGKSNDVEHLQPSGLRNRKQPQSRAVSPGGTVQHSSESSPLTVNEYGEHNQQIFVDHYQPQGATAYNNGWLSRIAALLVGEDPTQCYALICGNCRMHNGLASKEDFPFITYICPHCHVVNGPKIQKEQVLGPDSPNTGSTVSTDQGKATGSVGDSPPHVTENRNPEAAPTPNTDTEEITTEASPAGNES